MRNSVKAAVAAGFTLVAGGLSACSNAQMAAIGNWGQPAKVKVYSGGKLIYEGVATGKVENENQSDGYYFQDKCIPGDNKLVEVSGQVVITRDDLSCPTNRNWPQP
jgi:hypothetical protein